MHAEHSHPGVHGAHAQPGGGQRAEAAAAGHRVVVDEDLALHPDGAAGTRPAGHRGGIGAVAHRRTPLQHRTATECGPGGRVVAFGTIRVHRMRDIGRQTPATVQPCVVGVDRQPVGGAQPTQQVGSERAGRTTGGLRADLFVVVDDEQLHISGRLGRQEGTEPGVHRQHVVLPGGRQQFAARPDQGGRLVRDQEEVMAGYLVWVQPREVGEVGREVGFGRQTDQRHQVTLRIDVELAILGPVEVDRQARHPSQCATAHQMDAALEVDEASGHHQVAVEPGCQDRSAVDLDVGHPTAAPLVGSVRLELERGRVGVGGEQAQARARPPPHRQTPRRQRTIARCEPERWQPIPWLGLGHRTVSGSSQAGGSHGHRVVRGGAGVQELHQVGGVIGRKHADRLDQRALRVAAEKCQWAEAKWLPWMPWGCWCWWWRC